VTGRAVDLSAAPRWIAAEHRGLWAALGREWPSYFAYLVSFLVIGIIWINHHTRRAAGASAPGTTGRTIRVRRPAGR
jgi:hypothetical protein